MNKEEKPESRHAATEERGVPQYGEKVCLEAATSRAIWRQDPES
ncbi:hypothetical protein [aff. Roholtiella sp. LEGE 12411]|nr:hypothetical protein [aff. Roholtiella sp. LEGE 12411]